MLTKLPNVTIIIVDTVNYGQSVRAIKKSMAQVEAERVVYLTDINYPDPEGFEVIKIPNIRSKEEYSRFMIKELYKYFTTTHCLVIQHDGYILDGSTWTNSFLDYDYIGAPWVYEHNRNIGNGGFSLRSHQLQYILGTDPLITTCHHEDQAIGILYRVYLEETYGIKFPSEEVADAFSFELKEPACSTFGFHGHFHKPYKETIVIKRSGAMGDIIAVEPVLRYFYEKGYTVAIDCPDNFYLLFIQHHQLFYPIKHVSQIDQRRIKIKTFDLDMSYENVPKQLHLKSYFEACGVFDYKLSNPRLSYRITDQNRLFKKYVVLHVDIREQPGRNIDGVAWHTVVSELIIMGYDVIQVGKGSSEPTGAIHMNTVTENMLMWLIAGADMFIGIDSGPSHIAVALNIPSVIFFGMVNPEIIHPDLHNIVPIVIKDSCKTPYCWHNVTGCVGQDCYVDVDNPPCVKFKTEDVLDTIHFVNKRLVR